MEIKGNNLILSAFKKAEDSDAIVLRVFNPSERNLQGEVKFYKKIKTAHFINMNEEVQNGRRPSFSGNVLKLHLPYKKVLSIALKFEK